MADTNSFPITAPVLDRRRAALFGCSQTVMSGGIAAYDNLHNILGTAD
jgi:hypothetical protein